MNEPLGPRFVDPLEERNHSDWHIDQVRFFSQLGVVNLVARWISAMVGMAIVINDAFARGGLGCRYAGRDRRRSRAQLCDVRCAHTFDDGNGHHHRRAGWWGRGDGLGGALPVDAACWHGLDPDTRLLTTANPVELLEGGFLTAETEPMAA